MSLYCAGRAAEGHCRRYDIYRARSMPRQYAARPVLAGKRASQRPAC